MNNSTQRTADENESSAQGCRFQAAPRATLSQLKVGHTAAIHAFSGGAAFSRRLAALGFTPGTPIKMLQNHGHGPVIVTIRDTRIALGRGEADKVHVLLNGEDV